jgi:predicted AlkP superfamily pyrophosphatase or phosphodiesterase
MRRSISCPPNKTPRRTAIERVIVVVLDGLRADAIPLFDLRHWTGLAREGAHSYRARTVTPSVTAAAMASLFTGVHPPDHGLTSGRFRIPRSRVRLHPLPRALGDAGYRTTACLARVPRGYGGIATRLASLLGAHEARFRGDTAPEIFASARDTLTTQRRGLIFFHWPDADRAGHRHGWTSKAYMRAARRMDVTLGQLDDLTGASRDPRTLLVALADHGGGGLVSDDHDSTHPHDRTIPLLLAGGAVAPGELTGEPALIDIPATVLWALGVPVPNGWAGQPLVEAFTPLAALAS